MKQYVDGFVLVLKKSKLNEYKKMAEAAGKLWMKHGALEYFECVGDDLNPKTMGMKILKFPKMAKTKAGETVVFSFIVYKSKAHRNKVNAKVMNDMSEWKDTPMPFDVKRMAYGVKQW
jgi:alkaline phosphatase